MGWLSEWDYRKSINISRATGAVTNYQMKLLVGESSGASGEDVDCGGKCLSNFNDLRFTKSDGTTLLDYWIEEITGTTPNQLASVWIEFDSIGTSDTTFYMYYGNASAAAYSNGTNTFIIFDDFERGSDGDTVGGDWTDTTAGAAPPLISTAQKYGGTRSAKIYSYADGFPLPGGMETAVTASDNISIMFRIYKNPNGEPDFSHGDGSSLQVIAWQNGGRLYYRDSSWNEVELAPSPAVSSEEWHLFEFNNFNWATNSFDLLIDGVIIGSGLVGPASTGGNNKFIFNSQNYNPGTNITWIDNFIVRNYRTTEPAWGSWGSEENKPPIANGGDSVVYTDINGLNPTSVPTVDSYYKVHIFTSSGDLEVTGGGLVEYLIIGGGGAGGVYGGGGAGGVLAGTTTLTVGTKPVVVGDGGTPVGSGDPATTLPSVGNGGDSTFNSLLAHGGGGGGNIGNDTEYEWGADGGSGGGAGWTNTGSTAVVRGGYTLDSQGYDGGELYNTTGLSGCGGGGGAASKGGYGWRDGITSTYFGGNGGAGISNSMSGVATDYAGGGGGGVHINEAWWNYNPGEGSNGGGNGGINNSTAATPASANTGSGGGGGYASYAPDVYGTDGGSGIVIIRYLYTSEEIPIVQTYEATSETPSSFVANGEVTSSGSISERGFWYTDDNKEPTAADYIESETGEFTTGLFDLTVTAPIPGIDYKVKAFATNDVGTGSGESVVVSLPDAVNAVTVETLPETLITTTSFTANGIITNAGQNWYINGVLFTGPVVRVKAGESVNTALSNAAAGSLVIIEPGIYTGLYWVLSKKLYVKGLGGLPSDTVIPGRWDISSGNGGSIIENLTINGAILDNSAVQNQTTIFNKCIVGSSTGNTLHLYANSTWLYFINTKMVRSAGGVTITAGGYNTPAYVGKVFFQKAELNLPYITGTFAVYGSPGESDYVTTPTSGYGYVYNAVPQGTEKITVDGVPNAATRGFVYSVGTIENPNLLDYDGIYTESGDFGEGSFNHLFSGLTEGTNYRYRAYATNSYGTSYGDPEAVTTTEAEPSLDIYAATSIDLTSFSISGKITYNGGSTPTIRGFVYKIGTGTPTILDKDGIFTESGSFGGDVFSNVFSGLTPNQTYTIAAYATNSYATGYSSTVQVVTLPNLIITTNDCTNITASSFRANATISPSTFGVTVVGFLYTIDEEPYSWQTSSSSGDYTGTANFSKVIGAATNKYYLVKAYVDYRGHTYYGESVLVSTIVLTGITVTPVLPEINIGQTVQLTVVGTYSDSSVVDITNSSFYSAEDLAEFIPIEGQAGAFNVISTTGQIIASVSSGGLIVGMSAGLAKIFIYASEYKTSYNLVVVQPDEGTVDVGGIWDGEIAPGTILPNTNAISIIMDEVMYEGDSQQAYLLGMFDDSPETEAYVSNFDAVWSSSNTDVATVDVGGLIIGVAAGITFIKAVYTLEDSPVQTFTTMVMLRVEAKEGQWVIGQTYQYIPLMPIPNQLFRTTVATSKDRSIDLNIFLCWNKETICWEMTISDPISEEYYVDSIPLFVGEDSMFNLLRLYQYLNIGSCYIVDISGKGTGKPALNNLGVDFLMVWGYTE